MKSVVPTMLSHVSGEAAKARTNARIEIGKPETDLDWDRIDPNAKPRAIGSLPLRIWHDGGRLDLALSPDATAALLDLLKPAHLALNEAIDARQVSLDDEHRKRGEPRGPRS